jgi:hypothetical protein
MRKNRPMAPIYFQEKPALFPHSPNLASWRDANDSQLVVFSA